MAALNYMIFSCRSARIGKTAKALALKLHDPHVLAEVRRALKQAEIDYKEKFYDSAVVWQDYANRQVTSD